MKRSTRILALPAALAAGLSFTLAAHAVEASPRTADIGAVLAGAPAGTVLRDDDGGRVQIVPRRAVTERTPIDHGGPTIRKGTLHLIYLGASWQEADNRPREEAIASALFGQHGAGAQMEDPVDPEGHRSIADLEIQHRLARLIDDDRGGELHQPGALVVVVLAPGLESTLGGHSSRRDYAAYHNFVHTGGVAVHYVVVPYDADPIAWAAAARASVRQALINPEGTGWY